MFFPLSVCSISKMNRLLPLLNLKLCANNEKFFENNEVTNILRENFRFHLNVFRFVLVFANPS